MKSGEPGSPRRRGPPRQAYQYVRPLAVTFAIPLRLILTMARAELLQLSVEVAPGALSFEVPPLLLLPLCENAVKHGPAKGFRGPITISGRQEGAGVRLAVTNPGPNLGPRAGSEGLPTAEKRLKLAFGPQATLTLEGVQGAATPSTQATLWLPGPMPSGVNT